MLWRRGRHRQREGRAHRVVCPSCSLSASAGSGGSSRRRRQPVGCTAASSEPGPPPWVASRPLVPAWLRLPVARSLHSCRAPPAALPQHPAARRVLLEPVAAPRSRLDAGTHGTMGVGLGYAIAAAVTHPERGVVAVEGDSAFGFSGMECETICRWAAARVRQGWPLARRRGGWAAGRGGRPGWGSRGHLLTPLCPAAAHHLLAAGTTCRCASWCSTTAASTEGTGGSRACASWQRRVRSAGSMLGAHAGRRAQPRRLRHAWACWGGCRQGNCSACPPAPRLLCPHAGVSEAPVGCSAAQLAELRPAMAACDRGL